MEENEKKLRFEQVLKLADIIEKVITDVVEGANVDSDKIQKVIANPEVIFNFFESLFVDGVEAKPSILRLISGGEKIMIEALDGKEYVADAKKTFELFIDGDFKNWGLDQFGPATVETLFDVSEMIGDGTFVQIFTGVCSDLEKLVMTQAQIIRFCEKHRSWLRQEGHVTFFLTKVNGEYFVIFVYVASDCLNVYVYRLRHDLIWRGEFRSRIVSPHISLVE